MSAEIPKPAVPSAAYNAAVLHSARHGTGKLTHDPSPNSTTSTDDARVTAKSNGVARTRNSDENENGDAAVRSAYPLKTDYKRFVKEKKYIPWWIVLVLICVLVALMTIYHKQIVNWLKPVSARIRAFVYPSCFLLTDLLSLDLD